MLYCAFQNFRVEGKSKSAHAMYTCQQCHNAIRCILYSLYSTQPVPSYSCNDQKKTPKMISGTNQLILIHTECHQNI